MDYAQFIETNFQIPIYRDSMYAPDLYAKIGPALWGEVQMLLGDECYDPSSVFDLFRRMSKLIWKSGG